MNKGRKNISFYKGVLESAGLGEVSYFLKKAKQNLAHASFALENTDFSSVIEDMASLSDRIDGLKESMNVINLDIEKVELGLVNRVVSAEEEEKLESVEEV